MADSLFPPYNALAIDTSVIHPDWGAIARTIPCLPKSIKEDIAKLIMEHYRLSLMTRMSAVDAINYMRTSGIPYGGKMTAGGKGIIFNVDRLPADLQLMVAKYVIKNTSNN